MISVIVNVVLAKITKTIVYHALVLILDCLHQIVTVKADTTIQKQQKLVKFVIFNAKLVKHTLSII